MPRVLSTLLLVACLAGCSRDSVEEGEHPESPGRGRAIRADLGIYAPGMIPAGIGEPNKLANIVADEWRERNPTRRPLQYLQTVRTGTSEGEWLKTQLLGGIAPEIIHQNAEIAWPDTDKGWFVPLDEYLERPNPYAPGNRRWIDLFSNQALVGAKRAPDGKLYCISVDVVETGIFYNKDIFKRVGIERWPETWAEMLEMMARLDEAGYTPMVASGNLASNWGQDIIFELLYHDILPQMDMIPSRPDAEGYLGHYLDSAEAGFLFTKGFFSHRDPRWREMNRILRQWRRYWGKEFKNSDPDRMFLIERAAMYWSGSWFIRRMLVDPYVDFEWGVAYLPTITRATSPYGSGTPATVIGGAAMQYHITNSSILNDNVEDAVDFLMYVSAPRQIERMAGETLMFIPNVVGADMDERLEPFRDVYSRPYCAIKWLESMDGKYKKYWLRMLDYYLNDGFGNGDEAIDRFIAVLDKNFAEWVESHRDDAGWDFERMEKTWNEREAALVSELRQ